MSLPVILLLAVSARGADSPHPQAFRLEAGDYRWIPFTVTKTPTEVDCRFEVLQGSPTVHVELLPMSEFRAFNKGKAHETLAVSPDSGTGAFQRIIEERGQYAVVIRNAKLAPPAVVALELATDINPVPAVVARELPKERRLVVILISFALFFVIVSWSGIRLMRGITEVR